MTRLLTWDDVYRKLEPYEDGTWHVNVEIDGDETEAGTIAELRGACPTGIQQRNWPVVVVVNDQHYFGARLIDVVRQPTTFGHRRA